MLDVKSEATDFIAEQEYSYQHVFSKLPLLANFRTAEI
jgi:hypothetical protein